jgi:hypothetical protein
MMLNIARLVGEQGTRHESPMALWRRTVHNDGEFNAFVIRTRSLP